MSPALFTEAFITATTASAFILSTPILFAAIGEIYAERSGVTNLGLEGIMEAAAFIAFLACYSTGSPWLGILAALFMGILLALTHSFLCVKIGVNQVISGLLIVTLGTGIAFFGYSEVFGSFTPSVNTLGRINIPGLSQIPFLGPILFQQNILVYVALFFAIIFGINLYNTTSGLKIRATGENPKASDVVGINVNLLRHLCVIFGGAMAGLGGATLTVGYLGIYGEGIVAGRGWIAIIVTIFSRWSPYRAVFGSLLFGFAFSLAIRLVGAGIGVPYHLLMAMPYVVAIIAVAILFKKAMGPSGLMIPYRRGASP